MSGLWFRYLTLLGIGFCAGIYTVAALDILLLDRWLWPAALGVGTVSGFIWLGLAYWFTNRLTDG